MTINSFLIKIQFVNFSSLIFSFANGFPSTFCLFNNVVLKKGLASECSRALVREYVKERLVLEN